MHRTRTIVLPFFFALASVASMPPAAAADPSPLPKGSAQTPEDRKRADEFFRAGNKLYAAGKWAEAEAALRSAWELNPTFDVAANLGQTEYRLGKYRDAAEHLAIALRGSPLIGKQEPRELAKKRLDEVRPLIGTLHIQVNVAGAMVVVDGKPVGQAPLPYEVFVEPGTRSIEAQLAGYETVRQAVDVAKGDDKTLALALAMPGPPVTPRASPGLAWVIASGALAAGGLGAGIGLTVAANGKASDAASLRNKVGSGSACVGASKPASCGPLESAASSKTTLSNAAVGTFVAGGAFALAAVGLGVWHATTPKATGGVRVVPVVGSGEGGVVVVGSW